MQLTILKKINFYPSKSQFRNYLILDFEIDPIKVLRFLAFIDSPVHIFLILERFLGTTFMILVVEGILVKTPPIPSSTLGIFYK